MTDPSKTSQRLIEENSPLKQSIVVYTENVLNHVILILAILTGVGLIATPFLYKKSWVVS